MVIDQDYDYVLTTSSCEVLPFSMSSLSEFWGKIHEEMVSQSNRWRTLQLRSLLNAMG
jgi:hypothetical protein